MNIYYVYAYLNQKTGKPYYIGKGQGDRINAPHLNLNLPPKLENRVILRDNLSEEDAYNLEVQLIEQYGRKDIGTGILLNKTAGGTGGDTSAHREYTPMSDETKRKLRENMQGRKPWNTGTKGLVPGNRKPKDSEYRKKISESLKGYNEGVPKKKVTCPYCKKTGGEPSMKRWHFDNCKIVDNSNF